MQHGDYEAAIAASQAVLDAADDPIQRDHALLNLLTLHFNFGDGERAIELADTLRDEASDPDIRSIAIASRYVLDSAVNGDIDSVNRFLTVMARDQKPNRSLHYGVTMFNLACFSVVQDRLRDALGQVNDAIEALASTSGAVEQVAALSLRAAILLRLGQLSEASSDITALVADFPDHLENESLINAADALDSFGNPDRALMLLANIGSRTPLTPLDKRLLACTKARYHIRRSEPGRARSALREYPSGRPTGAAATAVRLVTEAYVAAAEKDDGAQHLAAKAAGHADAQRAHGWRRLAELLEAINRGPTSASQAVSALGEQWPWHLTYVADLLVPMITELSPDATALVVRAAHLHPDRWRSSLRAWLGSHSGQLAFAPGRLLEEIGERQDIPRLRGIAKTAKRSSVDANLGKDLVRRLADSVFIEDQGRVCLTVGSRLIAGSDIRRKVLTLLMYLVTRPDLAGTRDQVLDVLWPDLAPDLAQNSLNQTLYFLRRVFEEAYSDDLSPGYVRSDSDVIWLDSGLITSRSIQCRDFIRSLPAEPGPDDVERLVDLYHGRFALDFEYEEWASAYRDSLHAAYLEIVERAVANDFLAGHYDRGISVARRALDVDPRADQIEVSLLRLYRATGAHSAAAEQYAHYAEVIRGELGIEPPPLESL
jgi:DNA-binding SARP family transcriptional activator